VQGAIDAHVHLSERKDDALVPYARMNRLGYTLGELLGDMSANHVSHGLLLSPPMKSGTPLPNEEVIGLCRRSKGILSPVVTVEPSMQEVTNAIRLAEEDKRDVRAFKVRLGYMKASAGDPVFNGLYDFAEAERLPVLFHTGDTASASGDLVRSHPLTLDSLANQREELTIVACHFGNPWFQDVAELIYKHPNVYTDMSGLTAGGGRYAKKFTEWVARQVSEAIYFAGGAEKVLFGTDYPVTKHSDTLSLVEMLDIDQADKERILWRNAEKVFSL
jgi:uncharacterized protein